jgi:ABC-type bacteriocin/lantibiotic exporter with double-glycine peptidase domain
MLKRFFAYYRPYKGLFLIDFTCAVIAGLLELGFPLVVNAFIDRLLPSGDWNLIIWACAGLLKHSSSICCYLLGAHAWNQHRNRYAQKAV